MTSPTDRAKYGDASRAGTTDEFLDLAGHELRTPITALKGHIQLMQRRLRREPDRDADLQDLDKVIFQVERLNHELDVYLEAVHIERGRFEMMPVSCDLLTITQRLATLYDRGIVSHSIRVESSEDSLTGQWDRHRVQIAVTCVLANAVKFSRSGEVVLRLARVDDAARLDVTDRGIGVPPADRRRIFEAYERGSNAENAGAGLGLFVTREVVRRHKGRVGVRNNAGGGSIFWLTLPLEPTS